MSEEYKPTLHHINMRNDDCQICHLLMLIHDSGHGGGFFPGEWSDGKSHMYGIVDGKHIPNCVIYPWCLDCLRTRNYNREKKGLIVKKIDGTHHFVDKDNRKFCITENDRRKVRRNRMVEL